MPRSLKCNHKRWKTLLFIFLMLRQVKKYGNKGVKAAYVGKDQKDETIKQQVLRGEFQLVFMSYKSMLRVLKSTERCFGP